MLKVSSIGDEESRGQGAVRSSERSRTEMQTALQSIVIAVPLEDVFAAAGALERRSIWRRGVLASVQEAPGSARLGARCIETRAVANRCVELWDLEIIEFEQDDHVTVLARHDAIRVVEHHMFERD